MSPAGAGDDVERLLDYVERLGADPDEARAALAEGTIGGLALDLALRPPGPRVPFDEVAAATGLGPDEAARLWRALGFPDPSASPPTLGPDEASALRLLASVGRELLGPDATLALARLIGASTAQLAEALVDAFRVRFEMPLRKAGTPYSEVIERYGALARESLPPFLDTLAVVFRRHLVSVASGTWTVDDEASAARRDLVVGFGDLTGYTALAGTLTPGELARLVERFEDALGEVVTAGGGRVVKLIGDGAMFVADDAARACTLAAELVERFDGDDRLPPLRVSLSAGPVVSLHGDYYGDVVNLAARLLVLAEPSTVVVAEAVRTRVGDGAGLTFEPLPRRALKGVPDPPPAYVLRVSPLSGP